MKHEEEINDNGQLSMQLLEPVTFTSTVTMPDDGFAKDGTGSSPEYYLSCASPSNIICYNGNCGDVCNDLSNEEACTGGELIMLNAFLTSYDAQVASIDLDDLSYPLRLNTVQFCNGVQRIMLDDNLNILSNIAYRVISQQWVADKETAIIMLDGGQISSGNIEDLFDMIPGNDDLSIMVEDESPGSPAAYDPIDPVTGQDPVNPVMEVTTPVSYYLYDHLGNTRMIIRADDAAAMTITYAADYYPYGKILREWPPCEPERFLTTQHERDSESGYDNRGARLYDADVGRFLSVDPLAQEYAAWSPYNYVLGNPIKLVDPDGKAPEPPDFEATKIIVAQRISGDETNIVLFSTHMSIDGASGQVNGDLVMTTEQILKTNDRGEILSFTSTWTTTEDGGETVTETSDNWESADPQLQQTVEIISRIHIAGTTGENRNSESSSINIISEANRPDGSSNPGEAGFTNILTDKVSSLARRSVAGTVASMLIEATTGGDGRANFSNSAVLVDDYYRTGYSIKRQEPLRPIVRRPTQHTRSGALYKPRIYEAGIQDQE